MAKIFRIYASQGRNNYAELELPATDYEMLDLMDQLRLAPGQQPYMERLKCREDFDYLFEHLSGQSDIYQLNALAKQLDKLDIPGMAAFEGLVGMTMQKGAVSLPQLIDCVCSTDCCHVVEDATTDYQLSKFFAENDFVPEVTDLSDAAFALLDFGKIGKEHREAEGGVFTSLGYVEQYAEMRHVSETLDFQPQKPAYTILLNVAARPLTPGVQPEILQMRLPAPEAQIHETMERLGAKSWDDIVVSILDSPIPELNHELYLNGEMPQILDLADRLCELDARDELPKFKAVLEANECSELTWMLSLAGEVGDCFFEPQTSSPEDVARDNLGVILCEPERELLLPHIDLHGYGCALLEHDHAKITKYGLLEQHPHEQVQDMEQKSSMEGPVML